MPKKVFYAVKIGRNPGIYRNYEDALKQTKGFSRAYFKKFNKLELAQNFLNDSSTTPVPVRNFRIAHKNWDKCYQGVLQLQNVFYPKFQNITDAVKFIKSGKSETCLKRKMSGLHMDDNFAVKKIKAPGNFVEVFTCGAVYCYGEKRKAGIGVYWGPNLQLNTSKRMTGKQTILRAKIYAVVHALNQAKQIGVNSVALYTNFPNNNLDFIVAYNKIYKSKKYMRSYDAFLALDSAMEGINIVNATADNSKEHSIIEANKLADVGCLLPLLNKNISEFQTVCNETNLLNSRDKITITNLDELDSKIENFLKTNVPFASKEISALFLHNDKTTQKNFYTVYKGHMPGIYTTWSDCKKQLIHFTNSGFKHFNSEEEAKKFALKDADVSKNDQKKPILSKTGRSHDGFVNVFIDGSSFISDSIRAGIGVYWSPCNILNISLRLPDRQTNNRAEIWAAVYALHQAKLLNILSMRIHTKSQFVMKVVTIYLEKCKKQNSWKITESIPTIYEQDFKTLDKAMAGMSIDWCYVAKPQTCPELVEAERLAVAGCSKTTIETVILE